MKKTLNAIITMLETIICIYFILSMFVILWSFTGVVGYMISMIVLIFLCYFSGFNEVKDKRGRKK